MLRKLSFAVSLVVAGALGIQAQGVSDRFYEAIRNDDLSSLRALLKTSDVNLKDGRETTPLMYAAAFGSLDAMKLLLAAGADVNAKNAFSATALLWCAHDLAKVRLLIDKGADVNVHSKQGMTPLVIAALDDGAVDVVKLLIEKGANPSEPGAFNMTPLGAAAYSGQTAAAKLLLEKGVEVNVKDERGDTPLINAATYGNVELIRMLLAHGADVNAVDAPESVRVKNGPIALGSFTALSFGAAYSRPEAIKLLLDAGAKVDAQEVRGMTPLMLAVASDHADPAVIRLLLARGADPHIKSKTGESTIDWAKKFARPQILKALGIEEKQASAPAVIPAGENKSVSPKEAVGKSLSLLQRTSASFFTEGGCVSCHAQNLTGMAVSVARASGFHVDEAAAAELLKSVKLQWSSFEQVLLQRIDPPGAQDTIMYSVLQFAVDGVKPDRTIDAMVHNIAAEQHPAGNWSTPGVARPPIEDGDFSRTAICLRALAAYTPPGRKTEFDQRIQRAAAWLKSQTPATTEERSMQILGQRWAGSPPSSLRKSVADLIALQRADGGWSQTAELESDAYATGQVLYVMHEMGIPAVDAAYRRGVAYLLTTQRPDGSWHVASRAPKFQPYFQSGFPYDHDQWISSAATAWSTMALTYAAGERAIAAR